jgi:ABC-2 type transport system permease protein
VTVKALDITSKGIRENLRDRRGFIFLLGLPVLLIFLMSFGFSSGTTAGGTFPHEIVVINNDAGVTIVVNNTPQHVNYGASFTGVLQNATAENSTTHLFHLKNVSKANAEDMLKGGSIDALVIIPENFSAAFATMVNSSTRTVIGSSASLPNPGNVTSALQIHGDAGLQNFAATQPLLIGLFDQYKNTIRAGAIEGAEPGGSSMFKDFIPAETIPTAGTQSYSMFDYMIPGLIVFAIMLQLSLVTSSLVRDVQKGTLERLKLAKVKAFDLLSGTFLTWTLIIAGQVIILIGVAIAVGYKYQGGFSALGLATLIGVLAGMASISLALVIASFAKTDLQATVLGIMIATPLGFLAGAFMPLPRQVLGEVAGRTYYLWDILPWTWAISALRSVLTYGSGLSADVAFDMALCIFLTGILFVIGVATYARTRLTAEK